MMVTDVFHLMNGRCISVNTGRYEYYSQKSHVLPEELGLSWVLHLFWVLVLVFNCLAYSLKSILMPYSMAESRAE